MAPPGLLHGALHLGGKPHGEERVGEAKGEGEVEDAVEEGGIVGVGAADERGKSRRSTPVMSATPESQRAVTDWPALAEMQRTREELERRRRTWRGENTVAEREAAWRDCRCGPLAPDAGQGGGGRRWER
uniref:Uncharacterized protein n=1 Tax=Ananas comosus var. bracteatus TaxID=296719 RepID=A0A6V7Q421_ANACO|nr:unnamed protein product [Ananas comosus var. bracteatus]